MWPAIIVAVQVWKGLTMAAWSIWRPFLELTKASMRRPIRDECVPTGKVRYITLPLLEPAAIMLIMLALGGIIKGAPL